MPPMKNILSCLSLWLGSVLAAAALTSQEPGAKEWVETLSKTYAEQGGYLARYESKGENKSLEITVGHDFASSVFVSRMAGTKNGMKMGSRVWSKGDRTVFFDLGGGLGETTIPEIPAALTSLLKGLSSDEMEIPKATGILLESFLGKDQIKLGLGFASKLAPAWAKTLKHAKVTAVDADSITFTQTEIGTMQISRQTGMMTRQEIAGVDGEIRVLELKDFTGHPKVAELAAIYQDWDTAGAKPALANEWKKLILQQFLQEIIDKLGPHEAARAKLEAALKASAPEFKALFAAAFDGGESALIPDDKLRAFFQSEAVEMKAFWDQRKAENKPLPEGTFEQFLVSETVASAVVQRLQKGLAENPAARAKVTERALGKPLEADADGTRAARDQITAMLTTAYCTAMIEHQMKKFWPPKEAAKTGDSPPP
jgi:hypothetical protein